MVNADFTYVPSGAVIEFAYGEIAGGSVTDNFLVTPPDNIPEVIEGIVVNGQRQPILVTIAQALADTIRNVHLLEKDGGAVDGTAFAVILAGGAVVHIDRQFRKLSRKVITYGAIAKNDSGDQIGNLLQPLQLAEVRKLPTGDQFVMPLQMVVPLTEDGRLVAHKYGDSSGIAVGGIVAPIMNYRTSHVATVLSISFMSLPGEPIIEYRSPDADSVRPIYTFDSDE